MAHEHGAGNVNGAGYEVEDASVREVIFTAVGLAVGTIIISLAVLGLFKVLRSADEQASTTQPRVEMPVQSPFPPGPRLQEHPARDMEALSHQENQALTTYGWTDKASGKVRIPVDRAMDIVVQRGLPTRGGNSGAPK